VLGNYLRLSFDKFVNLVKISYMSQKANGKHESANSNIEHMMNNFKESNDTSFISFSDVPIDEYFDHAQGKSCDDLIQLMMRYSDTVTISTYKQSENNIIFKEITDDNLSRRVSEERKERKITDTDCLFIGVAWMLKSAFHFFMLCPEVVFLDVTSHSNNKGFHLLTFSSRISIGKQVVWMWIFIPNQQIFNFGWVFQEAIPTLTPKWLRDCVVFFMKDADPQQRNEILGVMKTVFVNNTSEGT
jgi:hypothetical protein